MKIKLLIGAIVVVALITIFYMSRPKEVIAPTDGTQAAEPANEQGATEEAATSTDTATTPAAKPAPKPVPKTSTTPTAAAPAVPYAATIVYTGTRFIPDEVTIVEGGTVRFLNTSTGKMWIASDNHPKHDRYPVKSETDCAGSSFDQCTSVDANGSWSFTFTRTGTWGFHNHLRAQDTGKIVVMTKEDYVKR